MKIRIQSCEEVPWEAVLIIGVAMGMAAGAALTLGIVSLVRILA